MGRPKKPGKAEKNRKLKKGERRCLKCRKPFKPPGPGRFLCNQCNAENERAYDMRRFPDPNI